LLLLHHARAIYLAQGHCEGFAHGAQSRVLFVFFTVSLDFDVNTGGKIKLHQSIDCLLCRF
jgi:hypothetical protein